MTDAWNRRRRLLGVLVSLAFVPIWFGCARKAGEPKMFTGGVITPADLNFAFGSAFGSFGKLHYAEVSHAWLAWSYADYRSELSAGQFGIVDWSSRAECTLFASAFEVYCQKRYFAQGFHSSIPAPGIAVGTIWFQPAPGAGHAINTVMTEKGLEYLDPQTGEFTTLTADQKAGVYFRKFD